MTDACSGFKILSDSDLEGLQLPQNVRRIVEAANELRQYGYTDCAAKYYKVDRKDYTLLLDALSRIKVTSAKPEHMLLQFADSNPNIDRETAQLIKQHVGWSRDLADAAEAYHEALRCLIGKFIEEGRSSELLTDSNRYVRTISSEIVKSK